MLSFLQQSKHAGREGDREEIKGSQSREREAAEGESESPACCGKQSLVS